MAQTKKEYLLWCFTQLKDGKNLTQEHIDKALTLLTSKTTGLKVRCVECGEEKAVRPDVYQKRIEKFGSEENLLNGYLCLKCRPLKKDEQKGKKDKKENKKAEKEVVEEGKK